MSDSPDVTWKDLSLTARELLLWVGSHGRHPFPLQLAARIRRGKISLVELGVDDVAESLAKDGYLYIDPGFAIDQGSYGVPQHVQLTAKGATVFRELEAIETKRKGAL